MTALNHKEQQWRHQLLVITRKRESGASFLANPALLLQLNPLVSSLSDLTVAFTAVNRSAVSWLKRHFRILPALIAYGRKHLTPRFVAAETGRVAIACPFYCTAERTTLRLISITPRGEGFLLTSSEGECYSTFSTLDFFVYIAHQVTSFPEVSWINAFPYAYQLNHGSLNNRFN